MHILILTSSAGKTIKWEEREAYVRQFCEVVGGQLGSDDTIAYTTYQDLIYKVIRGQVSITDSRNGAELKDYSFVHFKNWTNEIDQAGMLAQYLKKHSVPFANSELSGLPLMGKMSQAVQLAQENIPVPDTLYAASDILAALAKKDNLNGFAYPLIVKDNDGSRGDNNHLVHNQQDLIQVLKDAPDKTFVVQNFIPNDGDYRLLFVGYEQQPLSFLRSAGNGTHLNNTSQGGSGRLVPFESLAPDVRHDAFRAAQVLRREIAGVDVIINKETGQHYILEVNTTPALATGYASDKKVKHFVYFIQNECELLEEE